MTPQKDLCQPETALKLIDIKNLTVRYRTFTALRDFSCEIEEGCTGLLGPNGAGKTTFLKTLLGFVNPTEGGGTVLGFNIATDGRLIRQNIGLMPEQECHIPGLTAVGYVAYAGELAGMPGDQAIRRAHEVLEYCGLGEARYRNVETFSTGMKQRTKLAQAMIHGPKLLLLDEPTNGLDPSGREDMLALIRDISHGKGVNVLVSSHLLPDIERVCDRVMVVMGGQLRTQGSIKDLKHLTGRPYDVDLREPNEEFIASLVGQGATVEALKYTSYRVITNREPSESVKLILETAKTSGARVRGLTPSERSLEAAFMEVINS